MTKAELNAKWVDDCSDTRKTGQTSTITVGSGCSPLRERREGMKRDICKNDIGDKVAG